MKSLFKILQTLFLVIIISCTIQKPVASQHGNIGFQVFYDELSPYGHWTNYPNYGYVWFPAAGPDFSPYLTSGYWVMTDYGWTWMSDYSWGWAPFHYGRWDYDSYYGWFWVPDNEWGPSWVTWRQCDGYYGWAPMRPGLSISLSFEGEYRDIDRWNFVHDRDFGRRNLDRYYINRKDNDVIFRTSTVINNTYVDKSHNVTYISGPSRNAIQTATGRRITNVSVRDNDRPGAKLSNNQLSIYRPNVERTNDASRRSAPAETSDYHKFRSLEKSNSQDLNKNSVPVENNRRFAQPVQSDKNVNSFKQPKEQQTQKRQQADQSNTSQSGKAAKPATSRRKDSHDRKTNSSEK